MTFWELAIAVRFKVPETVRPAVRGLPPASMPTLKPAGTVPPLVDAPALT